MRGEQFKFFKALGKSFVVTDYDELGEQKLGISLKYFLKLMIVGTILLFLFSIPVFVKIPKNIDTALSAFNSLSIPLNYSQNGQIVFFQGDDQKQVTIDLTSNATTLEKGKILITNHSIIQKSWLGSEVTNTTGYSNVIVHKEQYKNAIMILLTFLMPSLIVMAYVFFSIKFFIMIMVLSFLAFVISRTIRFDVDYMHCFNSAVYAFTPALLFAMIVFPYNIHYLFLRIEWIGYAVSVVMLMLGLGSVGYFEKRRERKKEMLDRKRYVELR